MSEQEVKDTLNSIFEKHQTECNVCTSLTFAYTTWPCYRRTDYHPAEENAKLAERTDVSVRSMDDSLQMRHPSKDFQILIEVVQNAVSSVGVSCTEPKVTDEISYTKLNRLLREFVRL